MEGSARYEQDMATALERSLHSWVEDEIVTQALQLSLLGAEHALAPPSVEAVDTETSNVRAVECAIAAGQVSRDVTPEEQTEIFLRDYRDKISAGFRSAREKYDFPDLSPDSVISATPNGACQDNAVARGLPDGHPLKRTREDTSTTEEIHELRTTLYKNVVGLGATVRGQLYPQMDDVAFGSLQTWAQRPSDNGSWTYGEAGTLLLHLGHADVSCAVYDLELERWSFLNKNAGGAVSVILVKSELHYAYAAVDDPLVQMQVHEAIQRYAR